MQVQDLHKSYGEQAVALAGVDLAIPAGRFVSVMGPSGSGKSTLLHLMGGLDRASSGEIVVAGQALSQLSERELSRLRREQVGFVFQAFHLIPVLSAAENIALPATIAARRPASYADRLEVLLDRVGLTAERDRLPSQLSGGQQQRVALARALFAEPALVLADEPTGNLDSRTGGEVLALLRDVQREQGVTVVMVTHDAGAAAVGDEVVLLRDGLLAQRLDLTTVEEPERQRAVLRWLEDEQPARQGRG